MQRNCGVLAYDKLVGELNGRANEISMDTLAKLAQDNGFILYPMKVPVESMTDIPLPCILYTQHHFTFMQDLAELAPVCMSRKFVYLLSHEMVNPDWVMQEAEAKGVKGADIGQMLTPPKSKSPWEAMTSGSTGGWAGFAGPSKPTNPNDPKGWGWVGPVLTGAAGLIPGGQLLAAGMGAAGSLGGGTGFQGTDKGWGNVLPTIGGALGGYGAGMLGAGLGGAAKGLIGGGGWSGATGGFGKAVNAYNAPVSNFFKGVGSKLGLGGGKTATSTLAEDFARLGANQPAAGAGANPLSASPYDYAGQYNFNPTTSLLNAPTPYNAAGFVGPSAYSSGVGSEFGANALAPFGGGNITTAAPIAAGGASLGVDTTRNIIDNSGGGGGGFSIGGAFSKALETGLSTAVQSLGNLFGSPAQATANIMGLPEVQQYAAQIGQMKTQIGQMGQDELARILSAPMGSIIPDDNAYVDAMMRRTREAAERKKQSITSNYNAIGRVNSSEHMESLREVDTELFQAEQDLNAVIAKEKITQEMEMRLTALSGALGLDSRAASELAGLTGLSVTEAAIQFGLSAAQVEQIRASSQLTGLQSQLGMNPVQAGLQSMVTNLAGNIRIGG